MIKKTLLKILLAINKVLKKFLVDNAKAIPNLEGDRQVEWSWSLALLPRQKKVLDIGCCYSIISATAARLGNEVVGVDLNNEVDYSFANFRFVQGNIIDLNLSEKFDCIVLASTIEHVGLSGRYNSPEDEDGDLKTMVKIRELLNPGGEILLTLPVGQDAVFGSLHRVYGPKRLPQLLAGYQILAEEYWIKRDKINWVKVQRAEALGELGSEIYYGLGLYRLTI
jgi:SAM-dependent methyltransferase